MAEIASGGGSGIDTGDADKSRAAPAELAPGAIVATKYRVERPIGQGGMGIVVEATRLDDDTRVAIKVLNADALKNAETVARFEREARAVAKIGGDHVARIYEVGDLGDGAKFIVMEYLEGQDLAVLIRQRGALPVAEAIDYIAQACVALADAHAVGVVHRDLKPGNLFLTRGARGEPLVKLLDFGIAKSIGTAKDEGEATLTTTESFVGSPVYMSPEQMMSPKKVDCRADIWSLGVTLYRLLTRRVPFEGDTPMEICGLILSGAKPIPLSQVLADVPATLDAAVLKCLQREPSQRFRNVADLAAALAPFGSPSAAASASRARAALVGAESTWDTLAGPILPPVAALPPFDPDAIETLSARTISTVASIPRTRDASPGRRIWLALVAALVVGGGAFIAFRAPSSTGSVHAAAQVQPQAQEPPPAVVALPAAVASASAVSSAVAAASASAATPIPTTARSANAPPSPKATSAAKTPEKAPKTATAAPTTAPAAPATTTDLPGGVFGGKPF